jgi:hypothetical protein
MNDRNHEVALQEDSLSMSLLENEIRPRYRANVDGFANDHSADSSHGSEGAISEEGNDPYQTVPLCRYILCAWAAITALTVVYVFVYDFVRFE